jgi:hypothetical protein
VCVLLCLFQLGEAMRREEKRPAQRSGVPSNSTSAVGVEVGDVILDVDAAITHKDTARIAVEGASRYFVEGSVAIKVSY